MKIALIEKSLNIDLSRFDKVISFCRDNYINVDNYVKSEELNQIYDYVYSALQTWLVKHTADKSLFYLNTDILGAYGKRIFDFILNLYQKVHIVKKIIEKEAPTQIWISKIDVGYNSRYPFLSLFISDFIPKDISLNYIVDKGEKKLCPPKPQTNRLSLQKLPLDLMRYLLNIFIQSKKENILIYSDISKIPVLLEYLKGKDIIFLREDLPERLFFYLLKKGASLRLFSDFKISKRQKEDIAKTSNNFIDRLKASSEEIVIAGMNFTPYLKKYLTAIWQRELLPTLEMINQTHLLFKYFKIKSLLVDEDRAVYKNLLVQVARQYQCHSYVECHGEPFHKIGFLPLAADYIFVWGKRQKELLSTWGLEEERIIITGCSKYDRYLQVPTSLVRTEICKDLKLLFSKPIALVATCPLKKRRNIMENTLWQEIKDVITTTSGFKNLQIIIKLHPGDDNELYVRNLVKGLDCNNIKVLRDYHPLALAKGVDILIIYGSTFAIDGLAYQKPVILTDRYSMQRDKDLKVFYDGTTPAKLADSINGVLSGLYKDHIINWKSAVDCCLNGMDGTASEKVAWILSKDE